MTIQSHHRFAVAATIVWAALASSSVFADDRAPQLRIHSTQAIDVQRVTEFAAAVVTPERTLRIPGTQQVAVFGTPSDHKAVAEKIKEFETQTLLLRRIDIKTVDPAVIRQAVQKHNHSRTDSTRVRFDYDPVRRQALIIGRQSQLASAADMIQNIVSHQPTLPTPALPSPSHSPPHCVQPAPTPPSNVVRAPLGPVRIVHIQELDLLLIRARGGLPAANKVPAPNGSVQVHD